MTWDETWSLFKARDTQGILRQLISDDPKTRHHAAELLASKLELQSDFDEFRFLEPVLMPASTSDDPEVLYGVALGLARVAESSWRHFQPYRVDATALLTTLVTHKHKRVRAAAARALVAIAIQTRQLELAEPAFQHSSPNVRASATRCLMRCQDAGLDISVMMPELIAQLLQVHPKVKKASLQTLRHWVWKAPPTAAHLAAVKTAQNPLVAYGDRQALDLAVEMAKFLEWQRNGADSGSLQDTLDAPNQGTPRWSR
jgi:hypothetical protein